MRFWAQREPGAGGKSPLAEIVVGDIDMDVVAVSGLWGKREEWGAVDTDQTGQRVVESR